MPLGTVTPQPVFTGWDNNGDPLVGGLLYTYAAGTTTPLATYTDVNLSVANANPVVLDGAGRAVVYLSPASYKLVLKTSAGVTLWTADNIAATPPFNVDLDIQGTAGEALTAGQVVYLSDGSGGKTVGRWYLGDADFTYASNLAPMVGVVPAAIASAASGSIRLIGRVTGLSGLSAGTIYYISSTAGAMTATAPVSPANPRFLGAADSTTSLVLAANPNYSNVLSRAFRVNAATPYFLTWPAADAAGALVSDGAGALSFKTLPVVFAARSVAGIAAGVTTYYGSAYDSTTETDSKIPVPLAGTVKNLYVQLDGTPGGSETFIFTIRKNAVDQAVTCTVSAAGLSANNTANSFTVVPGDLLTVKLVTSAGASTRKATLAFMVVPS